MKARLHPQFTRTSSTLRWIFEEFSSVVVRKVHILRMKLKAHCHTRLRRKFTARMQLKPINVSTKNIKFGFQNLARVHSKIWIRLIKTVFRGPKIDQFYATFGKFNPEINRKWGFGLRPKMAKFCFSTSKKRSLNKFEWTFLNLYKHKTTILTTFGKK